MRTPSAASARSDSMRARRCSPAWSTRAPDAVPARPAPTATPMAAKLPDRAATVRRVRIVVLLDRFPVLTETFVVNELRALAAAGHEGRVEAVEGGDGEPPVGTRDRRPGTLRDVAWLAARHPLRVIADLAGRRQLSREEWLRPLRELAPVIRRLRAGEHIHVHFAAGAALDALRIAALTGARYSVTAHAW